MICINGVHTPEPTLPITGGPVMGKAICELIAGNKPGIDLQPFSPGRFRDPFDAIFSGPFRRAA